MNPRPPFPFSSFRFPFASSSPSSHLLLSISLPPRTGLGPLTSIPSHSLLVAGSSLLGPDRPWLWRPANPNPAFRTLCAPRALFLGLHHRPHMHPARGIVPRPCF